MATNVYKSLNISAGGSGGGIDGPLTSTDNAIARFDGTTGDTLQDSLVTIDDSGNVIVPTEITVNGTAVKASIDANALAISDHLADTSDAHDASAISSVASGNLAATDVQAALNELQSDVDTRATTVALNDHINDASDAHDASAISSVPAGNLAATDVQAALDELQADIDTRALSSDLTNHLNDTTDAHDASAISSVASGNLAATDVQSALDELQSDVDTRATSVALSDHISDAADAHAATAITNTPAGTISATTVQDAINELDGDVSAIPVAQVGVTAADTTPSYLSNKIVAGDGLSSAVLNPAGDEDLELSLDVNDLTAETTVNDADSIAIYDDSAAATRKMSRLNFLSGYALASAGDISEGSFALANNQAAAADVTGFLFSNAVVRSFKAQVSVYIDATGELFEAYDIEGVQRAGDWVITYSSTGDNSGVNFDITALGQVQYTSTNVAGYVSGTLKYRAETTSI